MIETRVESAEFHDCFASFDEAFESLSSELAATPHDESTIDLDEAFDLLDEQLAKCSAPDSSIATVASRGGERRAPPAAQVPGQLQPVARTLRPLTPMIRHGYIAGGLNPLSNVLAVLENLTIVQRRLAGDGAVVDDPTNREAIAGVFADARQLCDDFDLQTARVRTDFAIAALGTGHPERLRAEIEELFRHVRHDIQFCSIWPIAATRAWSFQQSFGEAIEKAFPSTRWDISEGGVCLGLGRHSACVFHMIRAAERGARALANAANAREASRAADGWSSWLATVEARVVDVCKWPAGSARGKAKAFFAGALADLRLLHAAARRLGSSGETQPFDEHEATAVCRHTKDLLHRLSDYINEEQQKTLTRRDFAR